MTFTRQRLWQLLGDEPEAPLEFISSRGEVRDGFQVEHLTLRLRSGEAVRGIVTRPVDRTEQRLPAILYMHSHGGHYEIGADELLYGQDYIGPLGGVFAQACYVTLCIDMPLFGQRRQSSESALSKALLWRGKTLMGQMLAELAGALGYLAARPDVDPRRIGGFGMSMGSTHAFMLGALDDRLKAVAHLCCFADYEALMRSGAHDRLGHYLTIPGLVTAMTTGEIAGAIAPRPQLICIGEADALTPPDALAPARLETETAYRQAGHSERLEIFVEPGIGHQATAAMREKVLAFFGRQL
jgi:dienelactone hydrolase